MKSGYLYVLEHSSDPNLFKIGRTIRRLKRRVAEHNSDPTRVAGRIVKETGQEWKLKDYIAVPDPAFAEAVFWETTCLGPFRGKEEVVRMPWGLVQRGLDAANQAGFRPAPRPLPDWVFAYTAWMKKRLEGRGISLVGLVKSRSGTATFRCSNDHEWRARSAQVADGAGCPHCGTGYREPEEVWRTAKLGHVCLLIHPDRPGFIKIGATYETLEHCCEVGAWDGWEVHRYRFVEDLVLAERLVWKLLGRSPPAAGEPIRMDLSAAEQAFRELIPRMHREIALVEKSKEHS